MDPAWSETGDRYMLKLFRDYLFHQVDENSAPWIDMAHVVQCMNKVGEIPARSAYFQLLNILFLWKSDRDCMNTH